MPNPNCGVCHGTGYIKYTTGAIGSCADCLNHDWLEREKDIKQGFNGIAMRDCLKELLFCKNLIDRIESQITPPQAHPDYPEYKRRKDAAWKKARELLT